MKKLLLLIMLLICVTLTASASETIDVKDYIKGKFPVIFNIYLASLGELDEYEKEFIDLLQNLPEEEQKNFAKEVYNNGFSKEILEEMKIKDTIPKEEKSEPEIKVGSDIDLVQDREFEYDFGEANWGMNEKQVRAIEKKHGSKSPDIIKRDANERILCYDVGKSGWGAYLKRTQAIYFLIDDKLWCGRYITMATFSDKYEWIREFGDWKLGLIEKYGEPLSDTGKWSQYGNIYAKNQALWGVAVSVGDLEFKTMWRTSTTGIELRLWGDDGYVHLHSTYKDITHMSQEFRDLEYPKAIIAFDFKALDPDVIGVIDEGAKTIALTVPFGTVVTALVPTIVYTGASVSPASGTAQDFTSPVDYTVTAEDTTTAVYTVTVTVALNDAKEEEEVPASKESEGYH